MSSDAPPSFDIDVSVRRGDVDVRVAFTAGEGATILFGPSGVGKTSVLDMVAGLLRPDRGHIRVGGVTLFGDGVDLPPERRHAGYVFQDPRLFPHLKVRANLLYGAQSPERLAATAAMLDIAHLLDRWPRTLSGGEARRVAIGRALLSDPRVLLLDEPLSSLDHARREEATRAILRVRDESGVPILMVTPRPRRSGADRDSGGVDVRGRGTGPLPPSERRGQGARCTVSRLLGCRHLTTTAIHNRLNSRS